MSLLSNTMSNVLLDTNQNNEDEGMDDISHGETSSNDDQGNNSHGTGSSSKSTSSPTGTSDDEATTIKEELARHETTNVFRLRILVIIILVVVAAAVAYLIYDITRKAEIAAFMTEFEGNADLIIASLNGKYLQIGGLRLSHNDGSISHVEAFSLPSADIVDSMSAIAGFAVTISVEAEAWPFVTLDAFHMRARNVEGADYITLNPIVQAADLAAWESYVQTPINSWM